MSLSARLLLIVNLKCCALIVESDDSAQKYSFSFADLGRGW